MHLRESWKVIIEESLLLAAFFILNWINIVKLISNSIKTLPHIICTLIRHIFFLSTRNSHNGGLFANVVMGIVMMLQEMRSSIPETLRVLPSEQTEVAFMGLSSHKRKLFFWEQDSWILPHPTQRCDFFLLHDFTQPWPHQPCIEKMWAPSFLTFRTVS